MKQEIINLLKNIIKDNYNIELEEIKLENPPKKELWDYAFGCFLLARDLKKNPAQIAWDIMELIKSEDLIESSSVAGPYLNIKVNKNSFTEKFLDYIESDNFEKNKIKNSNKTIIVDYISANIWKPLHIWHICTPSIGQSLINCYRKLWYNVIWDNHLWDWGIIFGKLIFSYKYFWEKINELEKNPIDYLLKLYIDITSEAKEKPELEDWFRKTFKKLSEWDKEYTELWKLFTSYSLKDLKNQLKRLNVSPDINIGESFFEWLDLPKLEKVPELKYDMKSVVNELKEKGIATVTENEDWTKSIWVNFPEADNLSSCILQKKDWTHWYLASDLACVKYRRENWNPQKIIYLTDFRQQLHFKQLFNISNRAEWLNNTELFHAYNWTISLKDWAMSTREWRIIKLDKLLDEAEQRAEKIILEKRDDIQWEELKELSKKIWIWAIKYWYLKKNRESDIVFDWDEFMSFEWNSGPYIQYAYVRAIRILEKENYNSEDKTKDSSFESSSEIELAKKIMNFNNILEKSTLNNYPHIIAEYAYDLTKSFSNFYNNVTVKDEVDENYKKLKLVLVDSFAKTLKESFEILGIEMPEKM